MRRTLSRVLRGVALLALAGITMPIAVAAQEEAETPPAVEYRQAIMQGLRNHGGAIRAMMGGDISYDHVVHQATIVNSLAQMLGDVFPSGSGHETSRALPAIWERSGEFSEHVSTLQSAAAGLLEAARAGDEAGVGEGVRGVFGTCRGCHTDFRAR